MSRKFFGTDGIRGRANHWPMNSETALRVGMAAGSTYKRGDHRHRVVIGKDTRLSGYMIEPALVSGFTAVGMDVFQFGPLPTPAVAMLTRSLRADMGVMISASHNKYYDNGIKLFGPDGYKLSDEKELEIEALMESNLDQHLAESHLLGRAKRIEDAQARYIESVKRTIPRYFRLDGLKVVVDCANGAAYRVAPTALWELGAEIVAIGVEPNGFNINEACGSTSLDAVRKKVVEEKADLGLALDGDADRVLIIDEKGNVVDGDQIMGLIATHMAADDALTGGCLVATVMSNLGLERYLSEQNIDLVRTQVGDRYVMEYMRANACNLGGEQSGHIIMSDYGTTGDGLVAGLQVLKIIKQMGKPASEVCSLFETVPQLLKNVQYSGASPLEDAEVKSAIVESENKLANSGRLLIRPSGTEPLIRVMAEGDDHATVEKVVDDLVALIAQKAG